MRLSWKSKAIAVVGLALGTLVAGCEKNERPVALSADYTTLEETPVAGRLQASDPDGDALTYYVGTAQHGHLSVDRSTGDFSFEPDLDFYGTTSFRFYVSDGESATPFLTVSITVENVNDPPRIASVPALQNSAETEFVEYQVTVVDPDPDQPTFSVAVDDTSVVDAIIDRDTGRLSLKALQIGTTSVEVTASDGEYIDNATFTFSADEVTREQVITVAEWESKAVVVTNRSGHWVDFVLEHNRFPVFENAEDVVDYVALLPDEIPQEPFERKLWRFLRDSSVHFYPLMPMQFVNAPWATLNSLGFGFCADIATTYVALARAAGYEARVWSIGGHIVPEVRVQGRWQLYDPDLGVYYFDENEEIAGVEQLTSTPQLVSDPINPILPPDSWPYSPTVTAIYATADDNQLGDYILLPSVPPMLGRFHLPPGATITYPGRWTEAPVAYEAMSAILLEERLENWRQIAQRFDGAIPYPVAFHAQAKLELQEGWTGEVPLPLWLWDVQGTGSVAIDEITYVIGSEALRERLRYRLPARSTRILDNGGIDLIMQINPVRFRLEETNDVSARGLNVWALSISGENIGANNADEARYDSRIKPTNL